MRLGLNIGYAGLGPEALAFVQEAERLDYASVWTAEAYGSDAVSVLAWMAAQTSRIRLGTGIMQMPARSPAMTAMTAMTLDRLSGGRFILGLGTSGPQVAEGWHGQRFGRQLQRTREYVEVVRMALARKRVEFHGETLELPLPDGPGKALKLMLPPVQERVPIYLAAIGPRNVALTFEIADGWLPFLYSPEHVAAAPPGVAVCPSVSMMISEDLDAARDVMRPHLALYVGGMGSREQNFYNAAVRSYGFEEAAEHVQSLYLSGRQAEAAAALPAELIDLVSLCGPEDVVRDRLRAFAAAGVDTLLVMPAAHAHEERLDQLRRLAALMP